MNERKGCCGLPCWFLLNMPQCKDFVSTSLGSMLQAPVEGCSTIQQSCSCLQGGTSDTHGLLCSTGETMHVDFGCLFDRGLTLEVPEVVPFRMTQNVVDMCGVSGVEGVLRCTAEIVLQVRGWGVVQGQSLGCYRAAAREDGVLYTCVLSPCCPVHCCTALHGVAGQVLRRRHVLHAYLRGTGVQ
jgi:hypothetical protein